MRPVGPLTHPDLPRYEPGQQGITLRGDGTGSDSVAHLLLDERCKDYITRCHDVSWRHSYLSVR